MKRIIYKLSFVPKIPIPHVILDNTYNYDGSFYLISEKHLVLTDFPIQESNEFKGTFVHVGHVFEAFLSPDEIKLISVTHAHFSQFLALNMTRSFYEDSSLYLIPVMIKQGNEWEPTLEWVRRFTDPPSISSIFSEILNKYDKKNLGEKLGSFFTKHGEWINRFVHFVISLEIPIKEFIRTNPILNNHIISKPELVALVAATKLQEVLIDRITKKEQSRRNQYSIIRSVAFNFNLGNLNKAKPSYLQKLECEEDPSSLKQNIPLLDIVNVNRNSSNEHLSYSSLAIYPFAVSQGHQRLIEIIENRDYYQEVCQRIPDNYTPPDPISLHPMDLSYLSPIAPIHLSLAPLLNHLPEQISPVKKSHFDIMTCINKASEIIRNNLLYRFKDLSLLRTALTDTTLLKINRKSLPSNIRLTVLGDAVLNFIISNIIFLANPRESVLRMSKMRSLILGGEFFRQIIDKINLGKYFISVSGGPAAKLPNHTAKKLVQAIFGAIFIDSNLSSCFTAFKYFVMADNKSVAESMFVLSPLGAQTLDFIIKADFSLQGDISGSVNAALQTISSSSQVPNLSGSSSNPQLNGSTSNSNLSSISMPISSTSILSSLMSDFPENHDHPVKYQNVYDAIKISFPLNYLSLFQAAFTHSSCSKSFTSNERLSFVGEAFTKLIISMLSYRCFPTADSDQLEYVIYEKMKELPLLAFDKQISTITVVQPGFEDKLIEPIINEDNEADIFLSLHAETLFAIVAAISFACGCNAAYQFIHQDILGLDWFAVIDIEHFKQRDLEERIKEKAGSFPHYYQYLVEGKYYTLMSVGSFRVPCIGMAKDPIVSKQDLINAVYKGFDSEPSIILTQKEYEEMEMTEPSEEFPQLQYNTFDS